MSQPLSAVSGMQALCILWFHCLQYMASNSLGKREELEENIQGVFMDQACVHSSLLSIFHWPPLRHLGTPNCKGWEYI